MTAEQLEELLADESGRRVLKHIAPSLARRVIAAQTLYDAADSLLNEIFGGNDSVDISMVEDALTAYREASN